MWARKITGVSLKDRAWYLAEEEEEARRFAKRCKYNDPSNGLIPLDTTHRYSTLDKLDDRSWNRSIKNESAYPDSMIEYADPDTAGNFET